MSLHVTVLALKFFGVVSAACSAYYWYRGSIAVISSDKNRYDPGVELFTENPNRPGEPMYVVATAMEQSRLNKIAASYTAVAVLAQAIATLLESVVG